MPRGPFVPIPLTAKVELLAHNATTTRPIVNVFHVAATNAPTVTELRNIANAIVGAINTWSDTHYATFWQTDAVRVTDLNAATGPQVTVASTFKGIATPLSPTACYVAELTTAFRGRSFTGRMFLPVSASVVTSVSGTITPAAQANVKSDLIAVETALLALTPASGLVVASRKRHSSVGVNDITVRSTIGYVDRRQFG